MSALRFAASLLGLALSGCVAPVFHGPVSLSTRPSAVPEAAVDIGEVSVKQCAVVVLIIPVLDPWDPRDIYDELLTKAEARGGHALVHYRARGSDLAGFYPFFVRGCVEHLATAVRLPGATQPGRSE